MMAHRISQTYSLRRMKEDVDNVAYAPDPGRRETGRAKR
jgi:hypothetical protein